MSWGGEADRAIIHIDGDSFFASCESSLNPKLRGKPVVTGKERGIASSMSYEAKARGVKRGMTLSEIRKVCPDVIILPSDYETYSLFSKRLYNIVRRYTPDVDEYSIDECFADITGLRRYHHKSYGDIASSIKHDLDTELGMTFSIGLGPNKIIAKIGSKWKKPSGLTVISADKIPEFTKLLPVEKVWGIGPQTTAFLNKFGIKTAFDFSNKQEEWVKKMLSKPYREIWRELNGEFVYPLNLTEKHTYQSISKTKTFTPPSSDREFVFSQLSKNIENACIKARRHDLSAKEALFFLKTQDFKYYSFEVKLEYPVSIPQEIINVAQKNFLKIYKKGILYRATGVVLMDLCEGKITQPDLFGAFAKVEKLRSIFQSVDEIDKVFGKHTVFVGSSMKALKGKQYAGERGESDDGENSLFGGGEGKRKKIGLPVLGVVR